MSMNELPKKQIQVRGRTMAYVEMGGGDPIVFLHGNPTSSYLWRNILPPLASRGRVLAPDLIGMGDSDKLPASGPDRYRFVEHRDFLDDFLETVEVGSQVVLVVHDWGSALGFDWARRHAGRIQGLAYMEAILRPITWEEFPARVRSLFKGFRAAEGENLILEDNSFVEQVLPGAILRNLTPEEMAVYRQPYLEPGESRRPTLTWPRQIPIDGEPTDVVDIVEAYGTWLKQTPIPKLFVNAVPGALITGPLREFARTFPNQTEVTVPGVHFVQEDSPDEIADAIADWMTGFRGAPV
ncbi:MAG: haloalkane dehalogenase [Acidobacteriota bacterium]|nr:haloalkane dehalogenase [Acidobacteriota bacterium]